MLLGDENDELDFYKFELLSFRLGNYKQYKFCSKSKEPRSNNGHLVEMSGPPSVSSFFFYLYFEEYENLADPSAFSIAITTQVDPTRPLDQISSQFLVHSEADILPFKTLVINLILITRNSSFICLLSPPSTLRYC